LLLVVVLVVADRLYINFLESSERKGWKYLPHCSKKLLCGGTICALDDKRSCTEEGGPPYGVEKSRRKAPLLEDGIVGECEDTEDEKAEQRCFTWGSVRPDNKVEQTYDHKEVYNDKGGYSDAHLCALNGSDDATKGVAVEIEVGAV